ncbi:MAG: potassium transporter TrkA [Gammaproteobacteria bacterium]|nr:potassium transporter TrkA [Gammaproteobacteria bacterium]
MDNIFFLIFRRMRWPLITLVSAYSIAVLGLVLIPGQDAAGEPWRMDFFHAFYFVSFMSTTIGFGEIPYEFTEGQRLWVTFSLYMTVVVWVYAIGNILALVQDHTFQHAVNELFFARRIRRQREPFYLVCGYGQTGTALVQALTDRDQNVVAVDIDAQRVNMLKLQNLRQYVPALHGDAARPVHLLEAGLKHRKCKGVVALTNVNEVNLKIAIAAKLLHPDIKVICRADSHDVEDNMASFGTDHIVDPYDKFARHLSTALQNPGLHLLHEWLTGMRHQKLEDPIYPPLDGGWIVCGFGRFGGAIYHRLLDENIETVVIEAEPEETGAPEGTVKGRGTEAVTLEEAGIRTAAGLVAGTRNDANNLSIIMTARQLNSDLFVIARQNHLDNTEIFNAVNADIVMHPSSVIANRIRVLLGTPLLYEFMSLALYEDDQWACELISRIIAFVQDEVPEVWEVEINEEQALAVTEALEAGNAIELGDLLRDHRERDQILPCIPLLKLSKGTRVTLPADDCRLKVGDKLLMCGRLSARDRMEWTLQNDNALCYVLTGQVRAQGWVWRLFRRDETR